MPQTKTFKCKVFFKGEDGKFYEGDMVTKDKSTGHWSNRPKRRTRIANVKLTLRRDVVVSLKSPSKLTYRRRAGSWY